MRFGTIIKRALIAGFGVGLALAAYTLGVIEPVITEAVALEEQLAGDHTHEEGEEALFSRTEQIAGGGAATVIYSVAVAFVFGTVYAAARHRLPGRTDLAKAIWLAAVTFGAVALMPAVKYPATPPAVGDPDTVGRRTVLYLMLIVASLLLAWLLTRLSAWLRSRTADPTRVALVTASTAAGYGLLLVALPPSPDAIDPSVPAGLVWDFRIRSIGGLALLWAGLGIGTGWLLERVTASEAAEATTTGTGTATAGPAPAA